LSSWAAPVALGRAAPVYLTSPLPRVVVGCCCCREEAWKVVAGMKRQEKAPAIPQEGPAVEGRVAIVVVVVGVPLVVPVVLVAAAAHPQTLGRVVACRLVVLRPLSGDEVQQHISRFPRPSCRSSRRSTPYCVAARK